MACHSSSRMGVRTQAASAMAATAAQMMRIFISEYLARGVGGHKRPGGRGLFCFGGCHGEADVGGASSGKLGALVGVNRCVAGVARGRSEPEHG